MKHVLFAAALAALATPAWAFDGWHLEAATTLDSKGAAFDYVTFDGANNRLFLGHRKEGLQAFDLATRRIVGVIGTTAADSANGAVLMPEFDLGISTNENGTITPFRLSTLEAQPSQRLGEELDTAHYDPATKRILVNMAADKDGTDLVVLEAPSLRRLGAVRVASRKPEHSDSDGRGSMFVASRDMDRVYRVDMNAMQVTAEWPTPGCAQTNGLAVDRERRRILVACRGNDRVKPSFVAMNADTGAVVFTAEIGGGNDGVVYDPASRRVFMANGLSAVLNVFEQVDADTYRPVDALGTRAMVKVLAYDPAGRKLHSMTAESSADFSRKINTAVGPFYPNTFFPNTFTVLTYTR